MNIPTEELTYLVLLAIVFMFVIPIIQKRTGKSLTEIFLGGRKKNPSAVPKTELPKEPTLKNDNQNDVTIFISQLLKVVRKNKMQLVTPGRVEHGGETARLLALIVHPSGVTGIYCLGFGGTITASSKSGQNWKQHMNGQDHTFPDPVSTCQEQYRLVKAAMDEAGLDMDLNIVTVFTNTHATLLHAPARVYTRKSLFSYLSDTEALKQGSVDIQETARILAELAHVKDYKKKK